MQTSVRDMNRGPVADSEIDVRALGATLWARRGLIIGLTLAAALAAFVAVGFVTPKYKAESRVLVETRENVFLRPDAEGRLDRATTVDAEAVASEVQLIRSRDLALDVIRQLRLADNREFDPALNGGSIMGSILALFGVGRDSGGVSPDERVLRSYFERLNVFAVDRSRVITIEFESRSPELAARVANAIADAYIRRQQEAKVGQNKSAGQFLAREIERLRGKVADAEQKVEDFRAGNDLLGGTNNATLSNQQLTDVNGQVAAVRSQKAEAEGKARLIRETLRGGRPVEFGEIVNSELMRRLTEQRVSLSSQLAEQSSSLLPMHPRIKELNAQIGDLERQMRFEAERQARALENEARMAGARLQSLSSVLEQLKRQAVTSNKDDVQLRALEREAKSQRDLLESYLAKYREATARDSLEAAAPDARVISRAAVSSTPAWPKTIPTVLITALVVLVATFAFVLTGALLTGTGDRVAVSAPRPALGRGPRFDLGRIFRRYGRHARVPAVGGASEYAANEPISAMEELAHQLRASGRAAARVTVVGTVRGLGTSATALELARILSRQARVVLMDLSPGSGLLAAAAMDPHGPGLKDLAGGAVSFGDIITRDRQSAAHLILAGREPASSRGWAASGRLVTVLEALARTYDHVILDSGAMADAPIERLAGLAPRAILVATTIDDRKTVAARDHLLAAGFHAVTVLPAPYSARAGVERAAA